MYVYIYTHTIYRKITNKLSAKFTSPLKAQAVTAGSQKLNAIKMQTEVQLAKRQELHGGPLHPKCTMLVHSSP